MTKLAIAGFVLMLLVPVVHAQDPAVADIAASFSSIQVAGSNLTANGGSVSVALNVKNWIGAVGDFALYHSSLVGPGLAAGTYTFGPRFSYRRFDRLAPFAQVLVGGVRYADNGLAFGAGGGVDIATGREARFALRPQVEYFRFRANGNWVNTARLSIGLVFHIKKTR